MTSIFQFSPHGFTAFGQGNPSRSPQDGGASNSAGRRRTLLAVSLTADRAVGEWQRYGRQAGSTVPVLVHRASCMHISRPCGRLQATAPTKVQLPPDLAEKSLLQSLVGDELAEDPEDFRRRLQQAFAYAHCL